MGVILTECIFVGFSQQCFHVALAYFSDSFSTVYYTQRL